VWFFSRAATDVPVDIKNGSRRPNPVNWGTPTAIFESGDNCDLSKVSHVECEVGDRSKLRPLQAFSDNNFIINLTFCGECISS